MRFMSPSRLVVMATLLILLLSERTSLNPLFAAEDPASAPPIFDRSVTDARVIHLPSGLITGRNLDLRVSASIIPDAISVDDRGYGIAVDASGNIYVAGTSPREWGAPIRAYEAPREAFVAKLSPTGALVWNTFLGGSGIDESNAIAVDARGNLYVTGISYATWESPIRSHSGGGDAFAAKLDPSGKLVWNTFLGGSKAVTTGYGIAVDNVGSAYVVGSSTSPGWHTPVRAYTASRDIYVAKLSANGELEWNTFLGGNDWDEGFAIAVDPSGEVHVTGQSWNSWGSPINAHSGKSNGNIFVAQLAPDGGLKWHTFFGAGRNYYHAGKGIALDGSGNIYVAGSSPVSWGSPINAKSDMYRMDAFIAKLNRDGTLNWNTFLGGSGFDWANGITADRGGNLLITGYADLPWGNPLRAHTGGANAFVASLDAGGKLGWNTFLGSGTDNGYGVARDSKGNVYVTGNGFGTWGENVIQRADPGGLDAFAAMLDAIGALKWNTFIGGSTPDLVQVTGAPISSVLPTPSPASTSSPLSLSREYEGTQLRVLVVESPWLYAIWPLLADFTNQTGIIVNIEIADAEDTSPMTFAKKMAFDVFMQQPLAEGVFGIYTDTYFDLNTFAQDPIRTSADYDFADFEQGPIGGETIAGKLTGIPIVTEQPILYYRKDILQAAGVEPPKTLQEFKAMAVQLTDRIWHLYGFSAPAAEPTGFASFLYAFGGDWFDPATRTPTLNTPEAIAAFTFYGELLRDAAYSGMIYRNVPDSVGDFGLYNIGMYVAPNSVWPGLLPPAYGRSVRTVKAVDMTHMKLAKAGYAPFPSGPKGNGSYNIAAWGLSISNQSRNREGAWEFVKWATSKSVVLKLQSSSQISGARKSVWRDPAGVASFPADWVAARQVSDTSKSYDRPFLREQVKPKVSLQSVIQAVIKGDDVVAAANKANAELQDVLNREPKPGP